MFQPQTPSPTQLEQPPVQEPISSRFWLFLTKIERKRSKVAKNDRNSARIRLLGGASSGISRVGRGWLRGWVVKSQK